MQKTKLTVRIPRELLENVKRYEAEHNTMPVGCKNSIHSQNPKRKAACNNHG